MKSTQLLSGATAVEQAIAEIYARKYERAMAQRSAWSRAGWGLTLALPLLTGVATAADVAATNSVASTNAAPPLTTLTKPAWLTDLSINVKESYDDNIFLAGAKPGTTGYPTAATLSKVPSSIAVAGRNTQSFVTTVTPKIGVNFAPLIGDQSVLQVLALGYAPDFVNYHARSSENYDAHKIATTIKAKAGDVSISAENSINAISGSKYGPLYPGSLNSAYATGTVRERRDQLQDRAAVSIQYDQDKFFVRPTASLLYYDLNTAQLTTAQAGGAAGYQNYADRYDVNGGADLGYKIAPKFAGTVGYRYGAQYQERYSPALDSVAIRGVKGLNSSSDYQRVLVGVEGKPWDWLDIKFQIGPDFRQYGVHAPVINRDSTKYYADGTFGVTITPKDSLSFKYKQYQWVSSTGKVPYFDSSWDLSYRRKLTDKLTLDLSGKVLESDYTSGLTATAAGLAAKTPNQRDDIEYVAGLGLSYAFNSYASVSLAYEANLGRNSQEGIVNEATREFDRNIVSLGLNLKF
jgi:hypothetical protein